MIIAEVACVPETERIYYENPNPRTGTAGGLTKFPEKSNARQWHVSCAMHFAMETKEVK